MAPQLWILRVRVQKIIWEVYEKYINEKEKHVWETHGLYGKYLANIWETPGKQTMECTEFILDFPSISVVKCLLGKTPNFIIPDISAMNYNLSIVQEFTVRI